MLIISKKIRLIPIVYSFRNHHSTPIIDIQNYYNPESSIFKELYKKFIGGKQQKKDITRLLSMLRPCFFLSRYPYVLHIGIFLLFFIVKIRFLHKTTKNSRPIIGRL